MKITNIDGVLVSPLNIIDVQGGDVLHGMKCSDSSYFGFGEAYFSMLESGAIKAWKRHRKMTLNLIVPMGQVRFIIYDDREKSPSRGIYQEVILSLDNYFRLTLPPMLWLGFQGLDKNTSMLLNIADIEHTPEEADRKEIHEIKYDWEIGT
jgi:dTDP-4-dehydrorhamnose 3,5-epimerase|tara:strand:- start:100 stop:552 length:453 start_codon:yes stop_codon:yes gene_type:complete